MVENNKKNKNYTNTYQDKLSRYNVFEFIIALENYTWSLNDECPDIFIETYEHEQF